MTKILTVTLSLVALISVACSGGEKEQKAAVLEPGVEQINGTQITLENHTDLVWADGRDELFKGILETLADYTKAPSAKEFPIRINLTEEPIGDYIHVDPQGKAVEIADLSQVPEGMSAEDFRTPLGMTSKLGDNPGVQVTVSVGQVRSRLGQTQGYSLEKAVTFVLMHEMWHAFGYHLESEGFADPSLQAENVADSFGNLIVDRTLGLTFPDHQSASGLATYTYGPEYVTQFDEAFYRMLPVDGLPFVQQNNGLALSRNQPVSLLIYYNV